MIACFFQKRAAQVGLLALCLLTSGCGTVMKWGVYSDYRESRADHEPIPQDFLDRPSPFVATKIDLLVLSSPFRTLADKDFFEQDVTHWIYFGIPFALVDLPFALVADAVFLPYDAGVAWRTYRAEKYFNRVYDQDRINPTLFIRHWKEPTARTTAIYQLVKKGKADKYGHSETRMSLPENTAEVLALVLQAKDGSKPLTERRKSWIWRGLLTYNLTVRVVDKEGQPIPHLDVLYVRDRIEINPSFQHRSPHIQLVMTDEQGLAHFVVRDFEEKIYVDSEPKDFHIQLDDYDTEPEKLSQRTIDVSFDVTYEKKK